MIGIVRNERWIMMKKTRSKRKMIRTTAVGLSLAIAPVLTAGRVLSVYAQPVTLTPDEQAAINTFLNTQPTNGTVQNLGKINYTPAPSVYTFPGVGNYSTKFKDTATITHLTQDFVLDNIHDGLGVTYKVKNWNTVLWYDTYSITPGASGGLSLSQWYWAPEVTLVKQSDNSEITLKNVGLEIFDPTAAISGTIYPDVFFPDFPIPSTDPRFTVNYSDSIEETYYVNGFYWSFTVPMHEDLPYDTIVTIDESLKTGEVEEDVAGALGNKQAEYTGRISNRDQRASSWIPVANLDSSNYMQYNSDVIYSDIENDFLNTDDTNRNRINFNWGIADVGVTSYTAPVTRELRVGIDYTHFVTEDGTELQPKVYGLQGVANFSGYEYVSTHSEPNGDRVHVYKLAPTPVTTPSSTATPKTGDTTNVFSYVAMMFTGLIAGVGAFFVKRKKFN